MGKHNLCLSWCGIMFGVAIIGALISMVDSDSIYYYIDIYIGVALVFLCCPIAILDSKIANKQKTKKIETHYQQQLDSKDEELAIRRTELEIERKRLELEKERLAIQEIKTDLVKFCGFCGKKLDSSAVICPHCGNEM